MIDNKILFLNFTIIGVISYYFYFKINSLEKIIENNNNDIVKKTKNNFDDIIKIKININEINNNFNELYNITNLNNQSNELNNNQSNELNNNQSNDNYINELNNIINGDIELLNECYDNIPCNNIKKHMSNTLWPFT